MRMVGAFPQPNILCHLPQGAHPIHDTCEAHVTASYEVCTCQEHDGRRDQGRQKSQRKRLDCRTIHVGSFFVGKSRVQNAALGEDGPGVLSVLCSLAKYLNFQEGSMFRVPRPTRQFLRPGGEKALTRGGRGPQEEYQ